MRFARQGTLLIGALLLAAMLVDSADAGRCRSRRGCGRRRGCGYNSCGWSGGCSTGSCDTSNNCGWNGCSTGSCTTGGACSVPSDGKSNYDKDHQPPAPTSDEARAIRRAPQKAVVVKQRS